MLKAATLPRQLFWSRPLMADEWALLDRYFGEPSQLSKPSQPAWRRMRMHVRRLGDTRRALSFNGGFLSFPRYCFVGADPRQPLRLDQPLVAGWLAHEAFHHWQRLQGLPVTREAMRLQWRWWRGGIDPYAYPACASPAALLAQFQSAQVEQQAQMWQDAVMADVRWQQLQRAPVDGMAEDARTAIACDAAQWHAVVQWVQAQG